MATKYRVQGPDGAVHVFEGPDDATPAQVEAFAAQTFGAAPKSTEGMPAPRTASTQAGTMDAYAPRRPLPKSSPLDFLSAPFEMGQTLAAKPRAEQAAFIEPTVEALGTAGGVLLGSPGGPPGQIFGAGVGYATAKELMRHVAGTKTPTTPR
jgi:hypothetical protein